MLDVECFTAWLNDKLFFHGAPSAFFVNFEVIEKISNIKHQTLNIGQPTPNIQQVFPTF
jgi:hypothetical protein